MRETDTLLSPLSLRGTRVPNRVFVSPMCQYSSPEGLATDWHLVHLGSRAVGGAGVVLTEATAVEPRGRISPRDLGIWTDQQGEALAPVAEFIRSHGSVPGIQLAHAGRKASTAPPWEGGHPVFSDNDGWTVRAPSETPYPRTEEGPPLEKMTTEDIATVTERFVSAAERALAAGFDVAEIHAAHGYLFHEFLSPVSNDRTDAYGGSFAARTRFLRETTAAVRAVWPDDKPLFVRISATDWLPDRDAWSLADSARLAPQLADAGADLIDVSSAGIHPDQEIPHSGAGYQVPLAERIKARIETEELSDELAVAAVGGITTPEHADAIIRNGRADAVALAREHLRDPYFTLHAADALDEHDAVEWPVQYRRAVSK